MQPRSQRVVDLLNEALTVELTVTNTYFLHSRLLDSWGFSKLGKVMYDLSIGEMRDADALIKRILMFDGHPNVQRLLPISIGEDAQEVLALALASELRIVEQFTASARECRELGDEGTALIFEQMVLEEEGHADWFESQLQAVSTVGIAGYLAQQIEAGTGPE
jgi:bacterioferritin